MAAVTIQIQNDIMIINVFGRLSFDEITDTIKHRYDMVTCHVLWDFSRGNVGDITTEQFKQILALAKEYRPFCEGGKTAYVSTIDSNFGMTRMFATMAEIAGLPYLYKAFRSFEEAVDWLRE